MFNRLSMDVFNRLSMDVFLYSLPILPCSLICMNAHKQKISRLLSKSQYLCGRNYKYKNVQIKMFFSSQKNYNILEMVLSICPLAKTEKGGKKRSQHKQMLQFSLKRIIIVTSTCPTWNRSNAPSM
jgi:hypothetical protein